MLIIDLHRCEGCGACVEACPQGALYLVEDKATVDTSLCDECQGLPVGSEAACFAACPTEAITLLSETVPSVAEPVRPPAPRPEPGVIQIETERESLPLRSHVIPVLGAMASWAAREILPRVADSLLHSLDRWAAESQTNSISRRTTEKAASSSNKAGKGRRHRRRRRGS